MANRQTYTGIVTISHIGFVLDSGSLFNLQTNASANKTACQLLKLILSKLIYYCGVIALGL